ncbi:MAG: hypothetical protein HFH38_14325 [Lachnospiraceae bacterium]|nr:hypothetical protein [Lachnospiraceae bacterium]
MGRTHEKTSYFYISDSYQERLFLHRHKIFYSLVKNAIISAYPRSNIKADGQVVVIDFTDGIKFEILPAFSNTDYFVNVTYTYPDTNMGGNWKSTNPKAEQEAMQKKNANSNGLLYDTCKHIRNIRDNNYSSYHLSGILIDAFVYVAIQGWHFLAEGGVVCRCRYYV